MNRTIKEVTSQRVCPAVISVSSECLCGNHRFLPKNPSVSSAAPIGFLGGTQWFLRQHPLVPLAAPKRQKPRYSDSYTHHFCCFFVVFRSFFTIFCCFFVIFCAFFAAFSALFRRFFADFAKYLSFYHTIYHFTQYCKSIRYNENDRMIDDFANCKVE